MLYNALIKEVDKHNSKCEVTGRILLKNLRLIPPTWTIIFRGTHLKQDADIGKLMCTAKDPISIYKGHVLMGEERHVLVVARRISVIVYNREGKKITFRMQLGDTLANLRDKVQVEYKLPAGSFDLRLEDTVLMGNHKTLKMANIEDGSWIILDLKENNNKEAHSKYRTTRAGVAALGLPLWTPEHLSSSSKTEDPLTDGPEASSYNNEICVTVDDQKGKIITLQFKLNNALTYLKNKISREYKLPAGSYELRFRGVALPTRNQTIKEAKIKDGSEIFIHHHETTTNNQTKMVTKRYRPGTVALREINHFPAQDVERPKVINAGVAPTHDWNLYGFGMNFYGKCPKKDCPSKKGIVKDGVSYHAGYGEVLLTPERVKFPCPACENEKGYIVHFPAKEFVLCNGRSLFRFKKSGVDQQVKTVVLESLEEDIMKYATFSGGKFGRSKYDFIEITTVKSNCSLHFCVQCDERINKMSEEVILSCGHVYHAKCRRVTVNTLYGEDSSEDSSDDDTNQQINHNSRRNSDCSICRVNQIDNIYQLLATDGDAQKSRSQVALVRQI